ncbi:hypothetical protein [Haloarcula sp. CGMCC 1.6347]|uniref:hypothetical protein n=1 Tax=Haloarcula sp. CGMCC 1.6347 TaxID=3111455 RepID=UPI00300EB5D0
MKSITVKGTGQLFGGRPYSVVVDGSIVTPPPSDQDEVKGSRVEGEIGQGSDTFEIQGRVTRADLPSHAELYVDGQQVDPDNLGGADLGDYNPPGPDPGTDNNGDPGESMDTSLPTLPTVTTRSARSGGDGGGLLAILLAAAAAAAVFVGVGQ